MESVDAILGFMTFGQHLARLMDEKGTSQTELAKRTGISQSAISAMIRGDRRPYFDQALKLATALGVSLNSLNDENFLNQRESFVITDEEKNLIKSIRTSKLDPSSLLSVIYSAESFDVTHTFRKATSGYEKLITILAIFNYIITQIESAGQNDLYLVEMANSSRSSIKSRAIARRNSFVHSLGIMDQDKNKGELFINELKSIVADARRWETVIIENGTVPDEIRGRLSNFIAECKTMIANYDPKSISSS